MATPDEPANRDFQDCVIVVSGLPRSGTSLMMGMLEAGGLSILKDGIRQADIDNPKGYYEFERVKKLREGDTEWLLDAHGKVVKIISYLLQNLPNNINYRVLFMQRNIAEVLASQRKMIIHRGEDPDKVREDEMRGILEKHLQRVATWMEKQANIESLFVNYNHLVAEPESNLMAVREFLGKSLNLHTMAQVVDPRLYRQRR